MASNDILYKTARSRTLIFGTWHCLVHFYHVYSHGSPGVQNGSAAGGLVFKNKIYLKTFFSRTAWPRRLKFDKKVLEIKYVALPNGTLLSFFK